LNAIQTYVFWNYHEEVRGEYDFQTESRDVIRFFRECQKAGLYVVMRIGPYACAEWNYGGFPMWLRDIPDIEFRTDNKPFEDEAARFFTKVVDLMKENKMFAPQGGPVILGQVENEYGNVDFAKPKAAAKAYAEWAADLALSSYDAIPWVMCKEDDAPRKQGIIATCNGYYCDNWIEGHMKNRPGEPPMWTENWPGWYQSWGKPVPHRPTVDVAFAVARFYAKGGTFQNYYMFHGGTNFGRTAGGAIVLTSYDYDVQLDEYGLRAQPKFDHLQQLHNTLQRNSEAILTGMPVRTALGVVPGAEAHVYGDCAKGPSVAFLSNYGLIPLTVTFNGQSYDLPAWSVIILENCKDVVFNSQKPITAPLTREMRSVDFPAPSQGSAGWKSFSEAPGIRQSSINPPQPKAELTEQELLTQDRTDYMWLSSVVDIPKAGKQTLVVSKPNDAVHAFVNGKLVGTSGLNGSNKFSVDLKKGENKIDLLSLTVGILSFDFKGFRLDNEKRGVLKSVTLGGKSLADLAPAASQSLPWTYQVGIEGEDRKLWTTSGQQSVKWTPLLDDDLQAFNTSSPLTPMTASNAAIELDFEGAAAAAAAAAEAYPLTWWSRTFGAVPASWGDAPVAIALDGMDKGNVWVNGHSLGRYWTLLASKLIPEENCSSYVGTYLPMRCLTGVGELSQRFYHIPREWLNNNGDNVVVVYEELGGLPKDVGLFTRV